MEISPGVSEFEPPVLGRSGECAVLDELVGAVSRGESRSLVVRGEAGVGKSTLLKYLFESANDLRVLRAVGVESEMELAYASLHQLCAPIFDRLKDLPTPQRQALESAFGTREGATPDRFLVGLGVLSLLSEAAAERPVLCLVDDGQWIDQASAFTLAFVARRLLAERLGIVFAVREPGQQLLPLPELEVRGLRDGDARALLARVVGRTLDVQVRDRIVAEARGNPLALLELPRGLTPTQLAGGFGLLGARTLSARIEETFVRQLEALPEDSQRLLLVAAAEPVGDPVLFWRATERLAVAPGSAASAEAAGLLVLGERVAFRHPLIRSAVYGAATVENRRAVHLVLADVTDRAADPDRRAWHLAAAAEGFDEEVARELEHSASRAQARGGVAAAAAFLQRAMALTDDPARRADRALAAAEASLQAGEFNVVTRLLNEAEAGPLDGFQQARADLVRAQVASASDLSTDTPEPFTSSRLSSALMLKAARRLEPLDLELSRQTYLNAWGAALMGDTDALPEISRAVRDLPSPKPARSLDLLLDGFALLITDGPAVATPTLQRAARALESMTTDDALRWGWINAHAIAVIWDFERICEVLARAVELIRDAGAVAQLSLPLAILGQWMAVGGDFSRSASMIAEADSVAAAIGTPTAPYTELPLLVLRGNEAEASAIIARQIQRATSTGEKLVVTMAHWFAAVLYNSLGQYDRAMSSATQATSFQFELLDAVFALPELVEAAVRAGKTEVARGALERLSVTTQPSATDWGLGLEARCRALVRTDGTAEPYYREAIERLGRTSLRPELARSHLVYGEWLRRERRRIDARAELRCAYEQFTTIGMDAFADRAGRELAATGETVRKRSVETLRDLTPQELQIARLAAEGQTNPEIGAQLFISARTVEWHLRKVFTKLDVTSRGKLKQRLLASGHLGSQVRSG
jgi:DNA-binding CsgD family transcriptional regulator